VQELRDRVLDANITAKVLHRHITRVRAESCTQPLTMIALFRRRRRREQVLDLLSSVKVAAQAPSRASPSRSPSTTPISAGPTPWTSCGSEPRPRSRSAS
jgi:hypothetical protein